MRRTVRIDDDLMSDLKARAAAQGMSLTRMLNRTLRAGLRDQNTRTTDRRPFRQNTYRMGSPRVGIDKALALAGALEDEGITRKMSVRK